MVWIKNLASGSFLVPSNHILHFHKKNLAVLDISRFTFCKVDLREIDAYMDKTVQCATRQ